MDITAMLNAYEAGDLDDEQTVDMFQDMINSGMAWTLQSSYGRVAAVLIESGECHR